MEKNKLVAERIRKRRLELNMTIDDLAEKTLLGKATIQRYETGSTEPTLQKLSAIAYALDVSWSYLLGLESKEVRDTQLNLITTLFNILDYDLFYDEVKEDYVFIKSENIPESYEFEGILKDDRLEKHHIHPSKLLDLQEEITNFAKYTIEKSIADTICDEEQYSLF